MKVYKCRRCGSRVVLNPESGYCPDCADGRMDTPEEQLRRLELKEERRARLRRPRRRGREGDR